MSQNWTMSKFFVLIASFILLVTRVQSWSLGGSDHRSYSNNNNPSLSRRDAILTQALSIGGVLVGKTSVLPAFAATDDDAAAVVTSPLVEVVVPNDAKKVRKSYHRKCLGIVLFSVTLRSLWFGLSHQHMAFPHGFGGCCSSSTKEELVKDREIWKQHSGCMPKLPRYRPGLSTAGAILGMHRLHLEFWILRMKPTPQPLISVKKVSKKPKTHLEFESATIFTFCSSTAAAFV